MFERDFENLLRAYGDDLHSSSRFSTLIRDFFPKEKKKANLILLSHRAGIADLIERTGKLDRGFSQRFVKKLMDGYGLDFDNALWAVSLWGSCYGEKILKKPYQPITAADGSGAGFNLRRKKVGDGSNAAGALDGEEKFFLSRFETALFRYKEYFSTPSRFRGFIRDCFPGDTSRVNMLLMAYETGIYEALQKKGDTREPFRQSYVKKLIDNYGMSEEKASFAISIWCSAFNGANRIEAASKQAAGQKSQSAAGLQAAAPAASISQKGMGSETQKDVVPGPDSTSVKAIPVGDSDALAQSVLRRIAGFLSSPLVPLPPGAVQPPKSPFRSGKVNELYYYVNSGAMKDAFRHLKESSLWNERDSGKLGEAERDYVYKCYAYCFRSLGKDPSNAEEIILNPDGSGMAPDIYSALSYGKPVLLTAGVYRESVIVHSGQNLKLSSVLKDASVVVNGASDKDTFLVDTGGTLRLESVTVGYDSDNAEDFSSVHILPKGRLFCKDAFIGLNGGKAAINAEGSVEGYNLEIDSSKMGVIIAKTGFFKFVGGHILKSETGIITEGGDINIRDFNVQATKTGVAASVPSNDVQYVYMAACTLSGAEAGCLIENAGAVVRINYCNFLGNEVGILTKGGKLFLVESTFENSETDLRADKSTEIDGDFCVFKGSSNNIALYGSSRFKMTNSDLDEAKVHLYDRSDATSDGAYIGKRHRSQSGSQSRNQSRGSTTGSTKQNSRKNDLQVYLL